MALCTRCLHSAARTPIHRTQWRRIPRRCYSSDAPDSAQPSTNAEDAEWFQTLRTEMLSRELRIDRDLINEQQEKRLESTLYSFFPRRFKTSSLIEIGNHLVFCNPSVPDSSLLPDGTDRLHSPGGSFVRRMWAGGAVRVNKDLYYDRDYGWDLNTPILSAERIKDVRLRGQGDNEKIFITIERKFARYYPALRALQVAKKSKDKASMSMHPRQKMRDWEQYFLTEDRNLVFMRERSPKELEDIKVGEMAPVKYLPSPGEPQFFHTLTPTSTLLSRFSGLTFNAHHIHLDRAYARDVEGHRNLLVHGPLTLTLMLKFMGAHLESLPEGHHIVQAIDYRNLAPLYCDEEMRLCAKEKEGMRMDDGRIYEVWIEGPTGGMAVKGTVRTAPHPFPRPNLSFGVSKPPRENTGLEDLLPRATRYSRPSNDPAQRNKSFKTLEGAFVTEGLRTRAARESRPLDNVSDKEASTSIFEDDFGTAPIIRKLGSNVDPDVLHRSPSSNSAEHSRQPIRKISNAASQGQKYNDLVKAVPTTITLLTPFSLPATEQVSSASAPSESVEPPPGPASQHPVQPRPPPESAMQQLEQLVDPPPKRTSLRVVLRARRLKYLRTHSFNSAGVHGYLNDIRKQYLAVQKSLAPIPPDPPLQPYSLIKPIREIHVPTPLQPHISLRGRKLLQRTTRTRLLKRPDIKHVNLIRYHNLNEVAHSRFTRKGARLTLPKLVQVRMHVSRRDHSVFGDVVTDKGVRLSRWSKVAEIYERGENRVSKLSSEANETTTKESTERNFKVKRMTRKEVRERRRKEREMKQPRKKKRRGDLDVDGKLTY